MDAAFAAIKKTVFFLALALLAATPLLAQNPTFTSPTQGSVFTVTSSGYNINVVGSQDGGGGNIRFSASVAYASGDAAWLSVDGSSTCGAVANNRWTPFSLSLSPACGASTLSAGNHTATVTLTAANYTGVAVTFTVVYAASGGGTTGVGVSPTTLAWSYDGSTLSPTGTQSLTLTAPNSDTYNAVVSYPAGATATNWLHVGGSGGSSVAGLIDGSLLSVSVANYASLVTGTYTGTVTVTDSVNSSLAAAAVVTLTVSTVASGLTISENPIGLSATNGYEQVVTVTSAGAGNINVTPSSSNGWLSATTASSSVAAGGTFYVTVTANTSLSGSGAYTGTILIAVGAASVQATVNLTVGTQTITTSSVFVAPTTLNMVAESGSSYVAQQIVFAGSGTYQIGNNVTYGSSSGNVAWLTTSSLEGNLSANGTVVTVQAHPGLLAPGSYTASVPIAIVANNTQEPTITLSVNLTVSSSEVLTPTPPTIVFNNSQKSLTSTINVTATGGSTPLPVSVVSSQPWVTATLQGSATTTPANILVTATTAGMSDGLYSAEVVISSSAAATVTVPVVMAVNGVANPSGLSPSPVSLSYTAQVGTSPASQVLMVNSTPAGAQFTATASGVSPSGVSWLSINPSTGLVTDQAIVVSVSATGLPVGNYAGDIVLTANASPVTVQVTLAVSSGTVTPTGGNVTVTPTTLSYSAVVGGAAPNSQTLTVSSASGSSSVPFTAVASSTGNWLSVSPTSGSTQDLLTVSVNQANLSAGNLSGSITITPTNGTPVVVQVSLSLVSEPSISVSPGSLTFGYQHGSGTIVSPGQLVVTSSGGTASFTASASSNGNWLSVTPTSGSASTTSTLSVQVNPASLAASTQPYAGTITITGVNGTLGSVTVNVSLNVTNPLPVISAVQNAASFAVGPVSPGEIVSIFGTALGPVTPSTLTVNPSSGLVSNSIGGVTVSFSGYLAPLIYVSAAQINAVVPYGLAGNKMPFVEVSFNGQTSNEPSLTLATSAPGIFTANGSGTGPGAILNPDGSVNSQTNPAARGSEIVIYMTGEGSTSPAQATGAVTQVNTSGAGPLTPVPQLAVSVLIGGLPAQVVWDGEAPGFVAGVLQVNVTVPATASVGADSVSVMIGKVLSQSGVTVWVK